MIISFTFMAICILLAILNSSKLIKNVEINNYKDFVEIEITFERPCGTQHNTSMREWRLTYE